MYAITEFRNKYYFLSNFSPCSIEYDGLHYNSVEAAFQAQKCPERAKEFCNLSASDARFLGRRVKLRPNWELVKIGIMADLLLAKFYQDPLRQMLLDTGDLKLIEGNSWGDLFWGADLKTGKGKNMLGILLMELRDYLLDDKDCMS